jgi:hypothetical protein
LISQEPLRIIRNDLQLGRIRGFRPRELECARARIRNPVLVVEQGRKLALVRFWFFVAKRVAGGRGVGRRPVLVDVLRPAVADGLDVEAFAEHADLAPRVPVGRHEDLIAVDDVVAEGFALYEGCYA